MRSISLSTPLKQRFRPNIVSVIQIWTDRLHSRNALAKLDQDQCADIGLTRAQARVEAAKPFWKA